MWGRPSRARSRALCWACVLSGGLFVVPAEADPQFNVSLISGLGGEGDHDGYWRDTAWFNAVQGDVLFGRQRNADIGAGPYLQLGTSGFDDFRVGGGGSVVLPITEYVPIVVSGGGYGRTSEAGLEPGLAGSLYIGARSYNFHSAYNVTGGLNLGLTYGLGDSKETTIIVAAQLDSSTLWLPFVILYNWIAGPGED